MQTSRTEHTDLGLTVTPANAWPSDIEPGHYYWLAPVGNPRDGAPPYTGKPRPSVINGDGMVYRVDLGQQTLTSSIVKPPDWWADELTANNPAFSALGFEDAGIMRYSLTLGVRNFGNTAFVPITREGEPPRLLVTYDPARPIEIDPLTLKTLSVVGYVSEYRAELPAVQPFPAILCTAHPFHDSRTGEIFLVNWGRSMGSLASTLPGMHNANAGIRLGKMMLWKLLNAFSVDTNPDSALRRFIKALLAWPAETLARFDIDIPSDFLYLMRWDGLGDIERWRVKLPNGDYAEIRESVHQVAATRDYVVLMDTSFKLDLDQFLFWRDLRSLVDTFVPKPLRPLAYKIISTRVGATVDRLLRVLTATPQSHNTILYLIPRSQLSGGRTGPDHGGDSEPSVIAQRVVIPYEAVHFLADYENPDDTLRVHIGHGCTLDLAEWMHARDRSIYHPGPLPASLEGLIASEVDISRMGRYEIEGKTGHVKSARVESDDDTTWGIALYAARNTPAWESPPPYRLKSVYWFTFGFWPETLSNFIYDMYADYANRQIALGRIRDLDNQDGRPCVLFRLDTETMTFEDAYPFANDTLCSSPQFVPKKDKAGDTEGYILCTVWTGDANEIWVFDGEDLASGPVCKLSSDALKFGFSLHSAYLPRAEELDPIPYRVDPAKDYNARLHGDDMRELFEKIYKKC